MSSFFFQSLFSPKTIKSLTIGFIPVLTTGYVVFQYDSPFTRSVWRKLHYRVQDIEKEIWQSGDSRPNRIVLIRHAQTHGYSHTCECVVEGLQVCALKPEMDRPLTEEGKLQALAAGVALKEILQSESALLFVSPYKSCMQTTQYILGSFAERSIRYVEDPRLRNQNFGDWRSTETPEVNKRLNQDSEKIGPFYFVWPQGESTADVYDRVCSFMETIYRKMAQPNPPENIVIVTHNVVILCFLMRWFHWPVETFNRLKRIRGGQVVIMEKQPDGSYILASPLQVDGPIPKGVREIASNPERSHHNHHNNNSSNTTK
jgi:broad specificity phosphatase PhoE